MLFHFLFLITYYLYSSDDFADAYVVDFDDIKSFFPLSQARI